MYNSGLSPATPTPAAPASPLTPTTPPAVTPTAQTPPVAMVAPQTQAPAPVQQQPKKNLSLTVGTLAGPKAISWIAQVCLFAARGVSYDEHIEAGSLGSPGTHIISSQREQMFAAQEMFKTANKVTRPEKALILGFMAGSRGASVLLGLGGGPRGLGDGFLGPRHLPSSPCSLQRIHVRSRGM